MSNIAYLTQLLFRSKEMEAVLDVRNESDSRGSENEKELKPRNPKCYFTPE